jgi:hypothetical protein
MTPGIALKLRNASPRARLARSPAGPGIDFLDEILYARSAILVGGGDDLEQRDNMVTARAPDR